MGETLDTQVVVLGGGPAGYSAAFRAADLGLDTVLVERYPPRRRVLERGLYPFQGTIARRQGDQGGQSDLRPWN